MGIVEDTGRERSETSELYCGRVLNNGVKFCTPLIKVPYMALISVLVFMYILLYVS